MPWCLILKPVLEPRFSRWENHVDLNLWWCRYLKTGEDPCKAVQIITTSLRTLPKTYVVQKRVPRWRTYMYIIVYIYISMNRTSLKGGADSCCRVCQDNLGFISEKILSVALNQFEWWRCGMMWICLKTNKAAGLCVNLPNYSNVRTPSSIICIQTTRVPLSVGEMMHTARRHWHVLEIRTRQNSQRTGRPWYSRQQGWT